MSYLFPQRKSNSVSCFAVRRPRRISAAVRPLALIEKFRPFKRPALYFGAICLLTAFAPITLIADAADDRDVYALFRAERYSDVADYFSRRRPARHQMELYTLARSLMEQERIERGQLSRTQAEAYRTFLKILDVNCSADTGSGLAACLNAVAPDSKGRLIERLAIWRAADYAGKHGFSSFVEALILRADLSVADPLSENLLTDRLSMYLESGRISDAVELAERSTYGGLDGPSANLWRARSFYRAGRKDVAFGYYIRSMRGTRVVWLERAIAQDVRRNYAEYFRSDFLSGRQGEKDVLRDIVEFAGYMPAGELRSLRVGVTPATLMTTTTAERVRGDGVFLIESGAPHSLPGLSKSAYTYLSHTPSVLRDWIGRLRRKKQDGVAFGLLTEFRHVLPQDANLWQSYIEILEKQGNKDRYFEEILAYQARFHAHLGMADRLINVLIGENASQIQWAPKKYWERARARLPDQTGNGRFVYWLKRYYLETKDEAGQKELTREFYARAPGSFYAGAFWEDFVRPGQGDRADFARDWQSLNSRADYLRWVARHGGNEAAVQYLRHRDLTRYMDPAALQLWKDFRSGVYASSEDLQQLYRLGERSMGANFFEAAYAGRVSTREELAREAYLGYQADWLHMSVYYTRQFARDAGVPEDPFSMPEGLLKALYPRPYSAYVDSYSKKYGIDSGMVYALMRQESMFREQAISRSGARGLMQIMPRTGSWLAGKMNIDNPNLMDPETNINMGAKFFSDLVRSQGDFRWAAIAYNGGPGNLSKWKKQYYKDDFYFFLENLPVEEPRNYCRVTFQNYMHYKTTYTLYDE